MAMSYFTLSLVSSVIVVMAESTTDSWLVTEHNV